MDLGLTRVDLLQVGLTYPKSAKLLPNVSPGEKAQQKVLLFRLLLDSGLLSKNNT